ncbi:MAG TPA: FAD-dependent oxidoreductase [Bryobacteraceae bacterium]|nr:FAD-dependent oxidoreductase [Bryobacteraceae bacterium]
MTATRRQFIGSGCAALAGMTAKGERRIAGSFVNDSFAAGHRIRDRAPVSPPLRGERIPLVIVGGGIAGLSAAWRLQKRGFRDFVLLEMNDQAGGNARSGRNEVTAYPWAAHYVPVPGPKASYVRELFEEFGVLRDGVWNERFLCFSPQERLFLYGKWQEGIQPAIGLTPKDRDQFQKLEDLFASFRARGGFTIPMEAGVDRSPRELDRLSFAEWLRRQGVVSPIVLWYMNYCCRDDYGAIAAHTSAWAGVHYFSSRAAEEKGPLTWPEGNSWITDQLLRRVGSFVRTWQVVRRIERQGARYHVLTESTRFIADAVIYAAPTFLAPYLIEGFGALEKFEYSPWLTANLTLDRPPRGAATNERAWDNVVAHSPTLGYVDATHQTLRTQVDRTVWTFYWALAEGSPAANRALLLQKDWSYWCEAILHDLERVHPDIRNCVSRIDIMRLGHAMARPVPGAIFDPRRRGLAQGQGRLLFANSDISAISIFEEAQFRGVEAAERILSRLGRA